MTQELPNGAPPPTTRYGLAAMALPALAHPGHELGAGSVAVGFFHPLLGVDHILAMGAVGLWAALLGGRAVWTVPTTFTLCMLAGFGIALTGISLPGVEPGIAASVVILGLLVAATVRLPLAPSVGLVGLFAVFHGHAHGAELTGATSAFALGFVAATALLHGAGLVLGCQILAAPRQRMVARGVGGAIAVAGLVLLGGSA